MLEESASDETQSFHQCERRDCNRVFRDGRGYSDFACGHFDASRLSSRECSVCGAALYLAEVNHALKVETWECAETACACSENALSPSTR